MIDIRRGSNATSSGLQRSDSRWRTSSGSRQIRLVVHNWGTLHRCWTGSSSHLSLLLCQLDLRLQCLLLSSVHLGLQSSGWQEVHPRTALNLWSGSSGTRSDPIVALRLRALSRSRQLQVHCPAGLSGLYWLNIALLSLNRALLKDLVLTL